MKRMTMKKMMKKRTMKMTMAQEPHLHLKRRKILQMRMEIPSHTTTWGPEDTALASTSTYSKKEKCHAAEWQNQIVCIASCTHDSCDCICSDCRTSDCTKHLADTERCECWCCKSDRRSHSFKNGPSESENRVATSTAEAELYAMSYAEGQMTEEEHNECLAATRTRIKEQRKTKFATSFKEKCQKDGCCPKSRVNESPPEDCRARLADQGKGIESDDSWERVPAGKKAQHSSQEYVALPLSGPIFFTKQSFGSSDSEEAASENAVPGLTDSSSEGGEEEHQDDPDSSVEEEREAPPMPEVVNPPAAEVAEEALVEDIAPLEEPEAKGRRDLKLEASSLRHLLTHLPKNPHCPSCQQAKMRQRYSHKGAFKREIDKFGEIITCDHVVAKSMRMQGLGGEGYGLSVRDLCTGMIALYPALYNGTEETTLALKAFVGRTKIHNI